MMGILLLLLIVFILWPLIRAAYAVYRLRRQAKQMFGQAARNSGGYGRQKQQTARKGGWSRTASKAKVIQRGEGEYVEWEEITGPSASASTAADGHETVRTDSRVEPQVVDVEWEDIKPDSER